MAFCFVFCVGADNDAGWTLRPMVADTLDGDVAAWAPSPAPGPQPRAGRVSTTAEGSPTVTPATADGRACASAAAAAAVAAAVAGERAVARANADTAAAVAAAAAAAVLGGSCPDVEVDLRSGQLLLRKRITFEKNKARITSDDSQVRAGQMMAELIHTALQPSCLTSGNSAPLEVCCSHGLCGLCQAPEQ